MQQFEPEKKWNRVLRSELDFSRFTKKIGTYSAEADVVSTLRFSKDNKRIICDAVFSLGSREDPLFISVTTRSRFRIKDLEQQGMADRLDMQETCRKKAVDYLYNQVRELYHLHTGMDFPLDDNSFEDEDDE